MPRRMTRAAALSGLPSRLIASSGWRIAVVWPSVPPVGAPPGPFGKRLFSARDQPAPMARETLDTTYATASPANSKEPRSNDVGSPNGIRTRV